MAIKGVINPINAQTTHLFGAIYLIIGMKTPTLTSTAPTDRMEKSARSRIKITLVFVLLVALVTVVVLRRTANSKPSVASSQPELVFAGLSDATILILQKIDAPVTVRFYRASDSKTLPEKLRHVTERATELLAEYERVADGKLIVSRCDPHLDAVARSAAGAEGIVPFNDESGDIHYLGVVVAQDRRIEILPQLSADWETALESDLSRAIQRVCTVLPSPILTTPSQAKVLTPIDTTISEELLKVFPDLGAWTFGDAAKVLRVATLEEFKTVVAETQGKVDAAQKNLDDAQKNKSVTEQQFASKEFQSARTEQEQKLKQITANLQERIVVLERLKSPQSSSVSVR